MSARTHTFILHLIGRLTEYRQSNIPYIDGKSCTSVCIGAFILDWLENVSAYRDTMFAYSDGNSCTSFKISHLSAEFNSNSWQVVATNFSTNLSVHK